MKKLLCLIITTILTLTVFTGCVANDKPSTDSCLHENVSYHVFDLDNHWNVCYDCNKKVSMGAHTEYGAICSVCKFTNPRGSDGLRYLEIPNKNEYCVSGFDTGSGLTTVVIASYYNGKPVTKILGNAFTNNEIITSVFIPFTINEIEPYAFSGCSKLNSLEFNCVNGWKVFQSLSSTEGEPIPANEISNKIGIAKTVKSTNSVTGYGRKYIKRTEINV